MLAKYLFSSLFLFCLVSVSVSAQPSQSAAQALIDSIRSLQDIENLLIEQGKQLQDAKTQLTQALAQTEQLSKNYAESLRLSEQYRQSWMESKQANDLLLIGGGIVLAIAIIEGIVLVAR